jgi:hypothetical protein
MASSPGAARLTWARGAVATAARRAACPVDGLPRSILGPAAAVNGVDGERAHSRVTDDDHQHRRPARTSDFLQGGTSADQGVGTSQDAGHVAVQEREPG